jgi:hypothetical protein
MIATVKPEREGVHAPSAFATKSSTHLTLGLITALVYKEPDTTIKALEQAGLEGSKFFSLASTKHDTQAVVVPVEDAIVVAFRGTESPTDVRTNLRFNFMPSPLGGRVHEGFYDALDNKKSPDGASTWHHVMSEVEKLAASGQYGRIYFTGHSLGGALATMGATRFAAGDLEGMPHAQRLEVAELVTFGQPKTFDKEGEQGLMDAIGHRAARYIHRSDMVPFIPVFGGDKIAFGPINIPGHFAFYQECEGKHYIKGDAVMEAQNSPDAWAKVSRLRMLKPLARGLSSMGEYLEHHALEKYYLHAVDKEMRRELKEESLPVPALIGRMEEALAQTPANERNKGLSNYPAAMASVLVRDMVFGEIKKPHAGSWQEQLGEHAHAQGEGKKSTRSL